MGWNLFQIQILKTNHGFGDDRLRSSHPEQWKSPNSQQEKRLHPISSVLKSKIGLNSRQEQNCKSFPQYSNPKLADSTHVPRKVTHQVIGHLLDDSARAMHLAMPKFMGCQIGMVQRALVCSSAVLILLMSSSPAKTKINA
jgi:hypothetical protein